MSDQLIVRLNAAATVNPADWEIFKQMVAETKEIVAREGPEQVVTHECYYDKETFRCLIVEAYATEAALLNHLELIKPLSIKYAVDWEVDRLELLGPFTDDVVEAMVQSLGHARFSHYNRSL